MVPIPGRSPWAWRLRPTVMGILNVTPDSFSDGGRFLSVSFAAVALMAVAWLLCYCGSDPCSVITAQQSVSG